MVRSNRVILLVVACLAVCSAARAQWLIYELRFQEQEGSVNFSFYTGAYVIAPIDGGASSVVFTTENGGSVYAVSENSVRYFIAANGGARKAVISAAALNGTAQAFYSASGTLDGTVDYLAEGVSRSASVATELGGTLLASDDESEAAAPAEDGSLGMIGYATIQGTLRQDLTQLANNESATMSDAVGLLVGLLEKYGYRADTDDVRPAQMIEPADSDISGLFGGQGSEGAAASQEGEEGPDSALLPPLDRAED